jgi:hypothetical protein
MFEPAIDLGHYCITQLAPRDGWTGDFTDAQLTAVDNRSYANLVLVGINHTALLNLVTFARNGGQLRLQLVPVDNAEVDQ